MPEYNARIFRELHASGLAANDWISRGRAKTITCLQAFSKYAMTGFDEGQKILQGSNSAP